MTAPSSHHPVSRIARALALVLLTIGLGIVATSRILLWLEPRGSARDPTLETSSTPIAVLGDSDSQSYHDRVWLPDRAAVRGGAFNAATLQWTEVLAKLRPKQIDLGPWGVWGSRSSAVRIMEWFGISGRAPRKEDFRYNFALGGAKTAGLMQGLWRQAPRLVALMDEDPIRWRKGIVVIRIGVNDFGHADNLDQLALNPNAPAVQAIMVECVGYIRAAVALIHERHSQTRIVLVGMGNNADSPENFEKWRSTAELANICGGLEHFNRALQDMAALDSRLTFFDDLAWTTAQWGTRDSEGLPAYRTVTIGDKIRLTNSSGDAPDNAVLADGHAGVVWNTLWAKAFVDCVATAFDLPIQPISTEEITHFLEHDLQLGR